MIRELLEGWEERVVAFLFWSAVFVPLLLGAVTIAKNYEVTDIDMLAGTGAPADGDGEWMSIGNSLTTWTPKTPPRAEAASDDAGGDGKDGQASSETAGDGGEPNPNADAKKGGGSTRPAAKPGASDPGRGKGTGDGSGDGVRIIPGPGGIVGQKKDCLPPDPRIRPLGDGTVEVDREVFDYYEKHLQEMDALARALPNFDDKGKPDGFRITGMRCGNPLLQAGYKNGDIIHTVNAKKVNSIPQAAKTWVQLRDEEHLSVRITRKEQEMTLEFDVVR